ncbi:hypothetical protein COCC4DRAFT_155384 [Bipolaris maydis ATCC 48331]|uniref:Uncharacterized protein n=2 Tax=Cochliobolus heterostrophus TaxID=5016 RepID=M2UJN1_COCH5|nr:uncharacterized protein COCC4DRAFT_155384 [Bipolaris maydis ATCC 48331]EMD84668.1 hypothetical protein COCHEDRAFT_1122400 [Bipolaris maydis C5]KAJ5028327.1 hypothetical protein J3E73DRAFT_185648 [Bipolaris maydis]EMD93851.1 hypothetical protein COCHEDRAFT_1095155 [Bipolaris maydis C5]ENH98590.1 hypothetical protein COCC4DRAFT_155384 [Bipolaris maydis ATCC 48331]KAJ5030984.1 hypothetical protein J3E73DRAFT_178211 [Bipolaris maydis]
MPTSSYIQLNQSFDDDEHPMLLDKERFIPHQLKWLYHLKESWKNYTLAVSLVIITALVSALAIQTRYTQCKPDLDTSGYLCAPSGTHPSVAHQRGCEYNWMSFHWLPKDRFNAENRALIREFEELGPWHRFSDAEGTQVMSAEETILSTRFWLTKREHLHHCQFSLRQAYLFMARGQDPAFNYTHIVHCSQALIDAIYESPPPDMDTPIIKVIPFPKHPEIVSDSDLHDRRSFTDTG